MILIMRQVMKRMLGLVGTAMCISPAISARAAEMSAATITAGGKVLILPFGAMNQAEYQPWLGRSIQQSVVADLMLKAPGRIVSSEAAAVDDETALDAGRTAGAQYVIRGDFASVGGDVRVTGQVLDVPSGKAVSAIKATGPSSNVFAMEDDLAAQISRRLSLAAHPAADGSSPAAIAVPPMNGVGVQAPPQPVDPYAQTYVAPVQGFNPPAQIQYNYYYNNPGTDYGPTPGGGWLWPGWGLGMTYVVPDWQSPLYGCHFNAPSSNRWNHSYAYGSADSVNGTPLGTGVSLYGSGAAGIAGGIRRGGTGSLLAGSAAAGIGARASTPAHVATTRAPSFRMSTGSGHPASGASRH